ncbi:MAG TPA: hypothetical protein VN025_06570 [Candidatus Dormibacteraeota bacterium]|jgi:hypothetical protein|nr:hypothetical protein [Candidatus Dormibacteraeota bacterium]
MNCEEFELIGLDSGTGRITAAEEAAAAEHAGACAKCAALAESWDLARAELSFFGDATRTAEAPARVQMRLLQELRAQKRPHELIRRTGMIAAWGLAAAAAIVAVISWQKWNSGRHPIQANKNISAVSSAAQENQNGGAVIVADEDTGAFTPLPGAFPVAADDGSIYQVRMQRASLSALGLPVNEEGASDWINVDLLVADDGTPQGVRLHEDVTPSGTIQ